MIGDVVPLLLLKLVLLLLKLRMATLAFVKPAPDRVEIGG